jgi:glycosyltransferase involved in cell wall biosynthesis
VYLEQHWSLFRKTPWLLDKLWDSKTALKAAAKRSISVDPHFLGSMTISMLEVEHGRLKKELQKMLRWLEGEPRPDVVNLPYTLLAALAAPLKETLGCPVVCTLQGEDLFIDGLMEPYRSRAKALIKEHLPNIDCFLAVSEYYAEFMVEYLGIPANKMELAPLGVTTDGYRDGPAVRNDRFRIGYFARVAPEKGLHILAEAYKLVREAGADCCLEAAGYMAPEQRPYLDKIEQSLAGLDFHYRGALDREQKIAYLQSLDVLSTPTVYADPKGIFVLEAMAGGVPFVQPRHGSFPEIVRKTGGGMLFEAENPRALADVLLEVIGNETMRAEMARNAYQGVREHYRTDQMAAQTAAILARLTNPEMAAARVQ